MRALFLLIFFGLFSCERTQPEGEVKIGIDNELFQPLNSCDIKKSNWIYPDGKSFNRFDISLYDSLNPTIYRIDLVGYNFDIDSTYFCSESHNPIFQIYSDFYGEHFDSLSYLTLEKLTFDSLAGTIVYSQGSIGFQSAISEER